MLVIWSGPPADVQMCRLVTPPVPILAGSGVVDRLSAYAGATA